MKSLLLPLLLALALVGVTPPPLIAATTTQEYVVGEGDMLKVIVYDNADLTTTARVSAEGTIRFPLIGQVEVGSLTVEQIGGQITDLLADGYLVNPQVSVLVTEFRSQKAIIMGQVAKPGLYELRGHTTFLELLSHAGGLTVDAGDKALVKRKVKDRGESVTPIDLKRLMEGGDTTLDVPIQEGDSVYIGKAGLFYVTGEVKKADAYKYEEGTTVIKAITMAGGFTDKAAKGRVNVARKVDGVETVLEKVSMHEPVRPDDVIVVPEGFF